MANVQKVAADKGVLTLSLLNMERAITEVAIVQKTQIIVVVEHVRETLSPTASPTPPTPAPTLEPTAASSGGTKWVRMVVGIVVAAVLLLTGFTVYGCGRGQHGNQLRRLHRWRRPRRMQLMEDQKGQGGLIL